MAGNRGGYRPGSGAKKGQYRVHVKELRDAIENMVGVPFQDVQATVFLKLYNDFRSDLNVKEFLLFNEYMGRRILLDQELEVNVSALTELTDDQLKVAIKIALEAEQTPKVIEG